MEYSIGIAIAFLIIGAFVLYMLIFALSWAGNYLCEYNDEKERARLAKEEEKKKREEIDREKLNKVHQVRTQYPPPDNKVTSFEITNIKDSIIVTETVYAD